MFDVAEDASVCVVVLGDERGNAGTDVMWRYTLIEAVKKLAQTPLFHPYN